MPGRRFFVKGESYRHPEQLPTGYVWKRRAVTMKLEDGFVTKTRIFVPKRISARCVHCGAAAEKREHYCYSCIEHGVKKRDLEERIDDDDDEDSGLIEEY